MGDEVVEEEGVVGLRADVQKLLRVEHRDVLYLGYFGGLEGGV